MTVEQVLQDIRSDRVKKVIDDGDFSAEIDDQYAMAYLMGSDKIDLLAVNAEAYILPSALFEDCITMEPIAVMENCSPIGTPIKTRIPMSFRSALLSLLRMCRISYFLKMT